MPKFNVLASGVSNLKKLNAGWKISPVTLYGEIVRWPEPLKFEDMKQNFENEKQAYIDWLDSMPWSFWCTLTTKYELTMKSGRRAAERYHNKLNRISGGACKMFFVLEPFGLKEGCHIHCLLHLPENFHDPVYFNQLVESWQVCCGTYNRIKDENDLWVEQEKSRISLERYKKNISASGYCTKYIMKDHCDYDILT